MKKRLMAAVLALVLTAALSASALAGETAVGTLDQAPRPKMCIRDRPTRASALPWIFSKLPAW